jgi:hypothetical protein
MVAGASWRSVEGRAGNGTVGSREIWAVRKLAKEKRYTGLKSRYYERFSEVSGPG